MKPSKDDRIGVSEKRVKHVFLKDVSKLISELSYNLEGRKLQIWIVFLR